MGHVSNDNYQSASNPPGDNSLIRRGYVGLSLMTSPYEDDFGVSRDDGTL